MSERSKMRARDRATARFAPPARRGIGSTPGITTNELEMTLEGMYRAPSLKGLDLIN